MPSRKKPRPSFDLPEETGAEELASGWVYRSNGGNGHAPPVSEPEAEPTILQNGSYAISYGISTMTQAMALVMAIATLPLAIGARVIEEWTAERSTLTEPPASDVPSRPA